MYTLSSSHFCTSTQPLGQLEAKGPSPQTHLPRPVPTVAPWSPTAPVPSAHLPLAAQVIDVNLIDVQLLGLRATARSAR